MNRRQVVDGLVQGVTDGAAQSHLWLAKYVAGDGDPRLSGNIHHRLVDALGACTTLRSGGLVAGQRSEPIPLQAQPRVAALCDRVVALQELTGIRVADRAAHGPG